MSPGAARVPRAPAAGAAPAQSGGTPSKATVEQFVAATSLEAVSMVGRAAMFLGNAVVDGIEGTAELVQNAAKKADKIAMNVARCVRRRDAPPFPSLFFFSRPFRHPESRPRLTLHLSSPRSPDGTPRGHASRARGADAWADFGDEKENATANAPSHRSRGGVGGRVLTALSNLSPGSRRARARGPASPTERAAAHASRSSPRKNSPSRAARSRAGARASSSSSSSSSSSAAKSRESIDDGEDWGWRAASPAKDEGELASAVRSAVAHLRRELDAANASETELRATLASVRSELAEARATTESLKTQNLGLQRRQVQRDQEKDGSDPLAEQVRFQLEALVKEKAELARENDALWRENESLQELLMHSNMASTAEAMYSPGGALADLVPQPDFSEADAEMTETKAEDTVEAVPEATETNEVEASEAKAEDTVEATETEAKTEIASEAPLEAKAEPVFETLEVIDAAAAPDAEMETRDAPVEEAEAAVAEAAAAPPPAEEASNESSAGMAPADVSAPEPPPAAPEPPAAQKPAKGKKGKKGKRGKK